MADRKLRVVREGETPATPEPPKTLVEATERGRREFLVRSRMEIARVVDAGVPAHTLGRLLSDMSAFDAEIRRLDAAADEESPDADDVNEGRRSFDASAI